MIAFLTSLVLVVFAEMGDKTQLLAMALATRYNVKIVMWGVLAAAAANNLLAVLVGSYLTNIFPVQYIRIATAVSFILFGLWTIRGNALNHEDKRSNFSPFWTVFIASSVAEMGDKTQLATIALAAKYQSIIYVWLGTTTGMVIAEAIGIIFGVVLGKKIPTSFLKWIAASIFIMFGIWGLYESLPNIF